MLNEKRGVAEGVYTARPNQRFTVKCSSGMATARRDVNNISNRYPVHKEDWRMDMGVQG